MTKNILIIGSGKLGLPLAQDLAAQGHDVTATTTTLEKVIKTNNLNIILWDSEAENATLIEQEQSNYYDLMIITIPPKRQGNGYLEKLMKLQALAQSLTIKKLLFISSTSIWAGSKGEVTENTPPTPVSDSAKAMVAFEQFILAENAYQACALKLAGLIGGVRQPGKFLANKELLSMAKAPINLVSQRDVIGIINAIINKSLWQQSLIACASTHPSRDEFYTKAANKLNLIPPTFSYLDNLDAKNSKVINSSHTSSQLNYQYQDDNLLTWLD